MKKTKKNFFKVIGTIFSSCGITATFTACYGCPGYYPSLYENEVDFTVFYDADGNGEYDENTEDKLIKEIKVSEKENPDNADITDEAGNISLFTPKDSEVTFVVEDIDGSENGGKFKSKEVTVDFKGLTGTAKSVKVALEKDTE